MDVGEIWFVSCLEVVEEEDNRILQNSDSARVVTALPAEGLLGPWTALFEISLNVAKTGVVLAIISQFFFVDSQHL